MPTIVDLLKAQPTFQIAAIQAGLEAIEAESLAVQFQLSRSDLANMLGLSLATLQNRVKKKLRLDPTASERLLRLATIAKHAVDIFGDSDLVGHWLAHPHALLDQATPLSLLDTAYGGHEIERILCSIEHGLPV